LQYSLAILSFLSLIFNNDSKSFKFFRVKITSFEPFSHALCKQVLPSESCNFDFAPDDSNKETTFE